MPTPSSNKRPTLPFSVCVDLAAAHLESDFCGFIILGFPKNSPSEVVVNIRTEDQAAANRLFDALGEALFPLDGISPFTSGPDDEEEDEDLDGDDTIYIPLPTPITP